MDTDKILEIVRITFPVFALLALGNILSRLGKMNEGHQTFLNWLVYYISLPALIFVGMAGQPFGNLLNFDFIIVTTVAMLIILLITAAITGVMRVEKKLAVMVIFSTYWSNVAYIGFPMSQAAFGDRGFLLAAIVNAVSMPLLIAISFMMIGYACDNSGKGGILKSLKTALLNPIIMASIVGLVYSWAASAMGLSGEGANRLPAVVREGLGVCETVLKSVGTMGLTLALIAIGGRLRFHSLSKNVPLMSIAVVGKLVVLPLISLILMRIFFASTDREVVAATVLLMTMPTAVTGAVIASQFKLDEDFMSAVLAVCMLGSVVMIPVWLYIVL